MELSYLIMTACIVFLSTNLDNLLCLVGFFSKASVKTKHVIIGWFAGGFLIIIISLIAAFIGTETILARSLNLLGFLPIIIGLKHLYELKISNWKISYPKIFPNSKSQIFTGAIVTLVNGSDNISAYIPFFILAKNPKNILITISIFIFMIAAFCYFGYFLVHKNKSFGKPIKKYGPIILPFVLISFGISLLIRASHD